MDEPSTGLDPASRNNLWNIVKEAKRDRAIILTSNYDSFPVQSCIYIVDSPVHHFTASENNNEYRLFKCI